METTIMNENLTTVGPSYILSDSVVIHTSHRGRTGYLHASYSEAWLECQDYHYGDKIFRTSLARPTEPHLIALLNGKHSTAMTLGQYSDPREAAYVGSRYHVEPVEVLLHFQDNIAWTEFPDDLYDLPLKIDVEKLREESLRRKREEKAEEKQRKAEEKAKKKVEKKERVRKEYQDKVIDLVRKKRASEVTRAMLEMAGLACLPKITRA